MITHEHELVDELLELEAQTLELARKLGRIQTRKRKLLKRLSRPGWPLESPPLVAGSKSPRRQLRNNLPIMGSEIHAYSFFIPEISFSSRR
jgi:hypothetical protein